MAEIGELCQSLIMGIMPSCSRPALVLVAAGCATKRAERVELIERAGHRVLEAVDGIHALAIATRYLPDVTVSDLALPQLDGLELSARLAANPDLSDIPVILVRDPSSNLESCDETHPIVASDRALLPHVERFVTARTSLIESRRTLRRALAAIRATAQDGLDETLTLSDCARQIANGTDETMISVLVADDNAHYVEANSAICALAGYTREQLLQMSIWDLSADDVVERGQRAWKRFLRDGRFEGSYRIRRSTGEYITLRCSAVANVVPGLHVSTMAPAKLLQVLRT
jgi:PAS domain S-box-containing protein